MIRIRTLGATGLTATSGADLGTVVRQPKRFALLAYLALARPRGFHRRDTLLGLFWPELDPERARAALRQSLYTLRRHLPDGVLVTRGDEEVAVSEAVWCDAWAFEGAMAAGRPAEALELYGGDLLEGFHIPDASPELGYWLDAERERLRRLAVQGAWQLAEAAAQAGNLAGVRRWATRAAMTDPLAEDGVRHQMTLLDRTGDRAGALAAYDQWSRRLREELDVDPSPETRALVEEIRSRDTARSRPSFDGEPTAPEAAAPPGGTPLPPPDSAAHDDAPDDAPDDLAAEHAGDGRRRLRMALGMATLALLAIAAALLPLQISWRLGSAAPSQPRVAVLPFAVRGTPEVAYLADGLAYLLSVGLEGEEVRAVDPHALLRDTGEGAPPDPAGAARVAERFGARFFVLGNVVGDEDRLRITASVYSRGDPEPLAHATATGSGDELLALVDRLSGELLTAWRGAGTTRVTRVAALTTDSLAALKAYLRGERLLRQGDFDAALTALHEAVARDTTFALAFYRMSLAGSWAFRSEVASRAAEQALRYADRLPEQERLLLSAHSAYRAGTPAEAEARARRLTRLYPEDPEGWYRLGEALLHLGLLAGRPIGEARDAFETAAAMDSLRIDAAYHLAQIEQLKGDTAAALRTIERTLEQAPDGARAPQLRLLRTLASGDASAWEERLGDLRSASDFTVLSSTYMTAVFAAAPDRAREVARLLVAAPRDRETQAFGHFLLAALELGLGRWAAARDQVEALRALDPHQADVVLALLASAPWAPLGTDELRQLQDRLERAPLTDGPDHGWWAQPAGLEALPVLYARGRVAVRLGDVEALERVVRELHAVTGDSARAAGLTEGLQVGLALARGERLESVPLPGPLRSAESAEHAILSPSLSQPSRRFLQAELLAARGSEREALGWYESLASFSVFDLVYGIPALTDRARIHERLGETAEAERLYRRFLDLWADADPALAPRVADAARALRRLQ